MDVNERLNKLEQQNKWMRILLVSALLLGLAFVTMGAYEDTVVRATRFVLVDAAGKERGVFGMNHDMVMLTLNSSNEKPLTSLTTTDNGPMLLMNNPSGKTALAISSSEKVSGIAFNDKVTGNLRLVISSGDDSPYIMFMDKRGAATRMLD